MFIFSQCSPFNFSDKFGLKILLQLSQKIATLVACRICRFPKDPNSFSETGVLE